MDYSGSSNARAPHAASSRIEIDQQRLAPLRERRQVSRKYPSNPITLMEAAMDIARQTASRILSISEALHVRVPHSGFDLPRHA
jgi:hypothetical protein